MAKQKNNQVSKLYAQVVLLSRNKLLYKQFRLNDNIISRINLIFLFSSCFFVRLKRDKKKTHEFSQNFFDYTMRQIELNLREIGYGDVTINKNMKDFVNIFYDILLKVMNILFFWEISKNFRFLSYFFESRCQLCRHSNSSD